jgi:hypothetical protein
MANAEIADTSGEIVNTVVTVQRFGSSQIFGGLARLVDRMSAPAV